MRVALKMFTPLLMVGAAAATIAAAPIAAAESSSSHARPIHAGNLDRLIHQKVDLFAADLVIVLHAAVRGDEQPSHLAGAEFLVGRFSVCRCSTDPKRRTAEPARDRCKKATAARGGGHRSGPTEPATA